MTDLHQIVAVATWDGGDASAPATAFRASEDVPDETPTGDAWMYVGADLATGAGATVGGFKRKRDT